MLILEKKKLKNQWPKVYVKKLEKKIKVMPKEVEKKDNILGC